MSKSNHTPTKESLTMSTTLPTAAEMANTLAAHLNTVTPGLPARLTSTHSLGEGVWQGDLGLEIIDAVPANYTKVTAPTDKDRQLVMEGGQGSHHRLASFDGVTLYHPPAWGKDPTDLAGPILVFNRPNSIVHESGTDHPHGTVFIDDPMIIGCRYQRNLDADELAARRAAD